MQAADKSRPVVLITGSAKRIGAAIARMLHAAGYDLVLHYRHSAEAMQALCAEMEQDRADSTLAVAADLADVSALPSVIEAAISRFGHLDALINNASAYYATPLQTTTEAQWDELFAVNARAPYFLCQAAAAHLRASGGAIVNITDYYADYPPADHLPYAASKAALVSITRGLARELAPRVRVNAIAPGAMAWPESGTSNAEKDAILARTPLARAGSVNDIATTVRWLLLDGGYVTGQVIRVDGGRSVDG